MIAVPILTSMQPAADGVELAAHTMTIWRTQVRFIGAGAIAVAAIYTLATLAKPVVGGLVSTLAASKAVATTDDRDRDISPPWIIALTIGCLIVAGWLAYTFAQSTVLAPNAVTLTLIAVPVRADRLPHRRHLRLHGGTHRRVEQPDLRRRHSVDRDRRRRR